jgi:hypothetical protein
MSDRLERCCVCGWIGDEEHKEHSGLSGLKGPGVCPGCQAEDFEEVEVPTPDELARLIYLHLESRALIAGAPPESGEVRIEVAGVLYTVEFSARRLVTHIHVASNDGTDVCAQCGLDLRDPIHTACTMMEKLRILGGSA